MLYFPVSALVHPFTLKLSQLNVPRELRIQHVQKRNLTILTKFTPHPRLPVSGTMSSPTFLPKLAIWKSSYFCMTASASHDAPTPTRSST